MALEVSFEGENGQIKARVQSSAKKLPRSLVLGVLLDGRHVGDVTGALAGRRGGFDLTIELPSHSLADQLDLVNIETGRSILPAPHDLRPAFAFRMDRFGMADGLVSGRFTVRSLSERLWVECTAGTRSIARGFAVRAGQAETEYSFKLPITSALPINEPAVLMPWVAGRPMPGLAVQVAAKDVGLAGFVDSVEPGVISGWAVNLRQPLERVSLDLLMDGQVVQTVTANQPRPDLGGGRHGRRLFRVHRRPAAGRGVQASPPGVGRGVGHADGPVQQSVPGPPASRCAASSTGCTARRRMAGC